MMSKFSPPDRNAQTAVEYLLLLGVAAVITLIGITSLLPRAHEASYTFFNRAAASIMGENKMIPSCAFNTCEPGDCGPTPDGCGGMMDCGDCCTTRRFCQPGDCGLTDDGCGGLMTCVSTCP